MKKFFKGLEAMKKQLASKFDMWIALHILKSWEYNSDITEEQYESLLSFIAEEMKNENISH